MQNLQIQKPCSENWNLMNATEKGAYCQKCATEVIDFTSKTPDEIKSVIKSIGGSTFCSRISNRQLNQLNQEFEEWDKMNSPSYFQSKFLFSMILIFGLSLFSCESEVNKEKIERVHQSFQKIFPKLIDESKREITKSKGELKSIDLNTSIEKVFFDSVIMGEMVETVEEIEDEIKFDSTVEFEGITMGMMISTRSYADFIKSTTVSPEYDENGIKIPTSFETKIYPNPSVVASTLEIGFPIKDNFDVQLFDMSGKLLQKIYQGELEKGTHRFSVEVSDYISGMYLIVISSEKYKETVRLMKQ